MAFVAWELPVLTSRSRIKENEICVSFPEGNGQRYLVLNSALSKELFVEDFIYVQVMQDDITGELGLNFTKERGLKMRYLTHGGQTNGSLYLYTIKHGLRRCARF